MGDDSNKERLLGQYSTEDGSPSPDTSGNDPIVFMARAQKNYETKKQVEERREKIEVRRHMSDQDIQDAMHSANPKVYESKRSMRNRSYEAERMSEINIMESETGLSSTKAALLLEEFGRNELEEKEKSKLRLLFEIFSAPMPLMIWIAIIIEAAFRNWFDLAILATLQLINGFIGFYETVKAGNAVAALKNSLKPTAQVKRDGKWQVIDAALLVPSDLVMLCAGSAIPADCAINEGVLAVDQAALTGESMPVTMTVGDVPKMGSTVVRGEVEATVQDTGMNTFFGKTAALIQSVDEPSRMDKVLMGVVKSLLILSVGACVVLLIYLMIKGEDFVDVFSFLVILLVASIPIAMVVVVTSTMALGARNLASKQAIVTRLSAIEELAGLTMLCSDKTGTLTLNKMVIREETPVFDDHLTREDVILYAALAARWNEPPKDALDTMVLGSADLDRCNTYAQLDYMPFDPAIKRTAAKIKTTTGDTFEVTKGAPHVILDLCSNKDTIKNAVDLKVIEMAERGIRSLAVAKTNAEGEWHMMGILTFMDPPRPDTKETIERAIHYGLKVKMITGDHAVIARETCRQLGMGDNIMSADDLPPIAEDGTISPEDLEKLGVWAESTDGFAQVFPAHKFQIVEALRKKGYSTGMTGDGVNDAPALKKADVGIAVQGSTDAARAAADIVLTSPGLSVVVDAIILSRKIFARIRSFILYRLACTLQLLLFFFFAMLFIHPDKYNSSWDQFFQMPVLCLILITILNDGAIISIAYDNVKPSPTPDCWNMWDNSIISSCLGSVACASSLLFLHLALLNNDQSQSGIMSTIGLSPNTFDEVVTMVYLKISISDFLTLFSARTKSWFFTVAPAPILFGALILALGLSTIFSLTWPFKEDGEKIRWESTVFVWVYCILWWFAQEVVKLCCYAYLERNKPELARNPSMKSLKVSKTCSSVTSKEMAQVQHKIQIPSESLIFTDHENSQQAPVASV